MLDPTTEEFNQKVCQNFNTSLQQVKKDVEVLKDWIRQQPHLPQSSSDTLLTTFLIASKNRMERAKEKIDSYYTTRLEIPEFFSNRDPEDDRARLSCEELRIFCMPKTTPDGCRVSIMNGATGDIDKFDFPAYLKEVMAYVDIMLNAEPFSMGEYLIIDFNKFTLSHILRISPAQVRDYVRCIQDVMPLIHKAGIVINAPSYVEVLLNLFRPFLKMKLLKRIHIHTEGPEILEKYFPIKLLPKDYGGEEDSSEIIHERWLKVWREKRDWLISEESVTVDETKRIGGSDSKKTVGLNEMQGSFKALCVD